MGWFGKLIGTDKAVDSLLDKDKGLLVRAGGWIGGLNYTKEEQAEGDAKTREWGIRQLEALAPFKVVQRILAFAAAAHWIFVGVNLVAAIWVREISKEIIFVEKTGKYITIPGIDAVDSLFSFATSQYVMWPTFVVFALYFAGGVMPRGADKK